MTIVSPENFLLFTPLLPEAASGSLELRHSVVPLRQMCPDAELLLGRAVGLEAEARAVTVEDDRGGRYVVTYEHLVLAAGSVPRTFPIPGLVKHAVGAKSVEDALYLRNHMLRELEAAERSEEDERARHLTFVFVGAGYAGVEALAELHDLAQDALRHYPRLRGVPQRWVLADTAPRILPEIPDRLANYAARHLAAAGIDIRPGTSVERVEDGRVEMTDGTTLETNTLVWTAGVNPSPVLGDFSLPLDDRGHVRVDETLRVEGQERVWALGDCAAVPNRATDGSPDPPTSQHAVQQARQLARNLISVRAGQSPEPYCYRNRGQVATLGRYRGVANLMGVLLSGFPGWFAARTVHVLQVPGWSRRLRILGDWTFSLLFRRDIVAFGSVTEAPTLARAASEAQANPPPSTDGESPPEGRQA